MIVKDYDSIDNYQLILEAFLERQNNNDHKCNIDTLYFVNFDNKYELSKINADYTLQDLGQVDIKDIIRYFTLNRR